MAKKPSSYCIAAGCENNSQTCPDLSFFRIPKNESRANTWLQILGRTDLKSRPLHLLHNYRVCAKHFDESAFLNPQKNRLVHSAEPAGYESEAQPNRGNEPEEELFACEEMLPITAAIKRGPDSGDNSPCLEIEVRKILEDILSNMKGMESLQDVVESIYSASDYNPIVMIHWIRQETYVEAINTNPLLLNTVAADIGPPQGAGGYTSDEFRHLIIRSCMDGLALEVKNIGDHDAVFQCSTLEASFTFLSNLVLFACKAWCLDLARLHGRMGVRFVVSSKLVEEIRPVRVPHAIW